MCHAGGVGQVSAERMLVVDTPPLLSASMLAALLKGDLAAAASDVPPDCLHDLRNLQLAVWMLSVCHVVLVVGVTTSVDSFSQAFITLNASNVKGFNKLTMKRRYPFRRILENAKIIFDGLHTENFAS